MAGCDSKIGLGGESVAVIGAGPAGLTAAYLLAKEGVIGGHRFFSKSKAVEDLWTELAAVVYMAR